MNHMERDVKKEGNKKRIRIVARWRNVKFIIAKTYGIHFLCVQTKHYTISNVMRDVFVSIKRIKY